ncbi:MAG: hypothetical protein GY756_25490 [bacterium]|nr:hypothetical protein [bacterium]
MNKDIDNILVLSLSRTIQNSFPKKSENFIRKAKKQLPKNMPTVVHLELPYENNSKFADYTDSSYDMIFNYINRNTRRINAVIISSMILDLNNFPYIQYIPLIVPSYNSYHQFPSTYDLVGVKNKKIPINLKEFVIDCNFKTPNTITETIQSILLNHSSNDGKEQLKIWYISRKKVRIELVNQFHKRDYIDIKCEIIPAMSYRFIFECSTNRFRVFLFQSDYKGSLKDKCYLKEI